MGTVSYTHLENDDITRKATCEYLGYLGTELDEVKNDVHGETAIISTDDSKVTLLCVCLLYTS